MSADCACPSCPRHCCKGGKFVRREPLQGQCRCCCWAEMGYACTMFCRSLLSRCDKSCPICAHKSVNMSFRAFPQCRLNHADNAECGAGSYYKGDIVHAAVVLGNVDKASPHTLLLCDAGPSRVPFESLKHLFLTGPLPSIFSPGTRTCCFVQVLPLSVEIE